MRERIGRYFDLRSRARCFDFGIRARRAVGGLRKRAVSLIAPSNDDDRVRPRA